MADQVILAIILGILPALVWLLFWLREDRKHPEPKRVISRTFLLGMVAVIVVLPLQKGVEILSGSTLTLMVLFSWAALEEMLKFLAGYFGGLHSKEDNEPIDPMIYMITAALGFVALENTLFILNPILGGDLSQSIITGNLRFVGASLLHVIASGMVGACLSFSFYRERLKRFMAGFSGLLLAALFHTGFNFSIIKWGDTGTTLAFGAVWLGIIVLLLLFERAKYIARYE